MKKILILTSFTVFAIPSEINAQNAITSTIKMNAETGEIISGLPTSLAFGDQLNFQLYFDPSYKTKEVKKLLDHHFTAYQKIDKLITENNKGILLLKDPNGEIRDFVEYNKGGYKSNTASWTRIPHRDGFSIHPEVNGIRYSVSSQAITEHVVISEIVYDPVSSRINMDATAAFEEVDQMVEVLNLGTGKVSLKGWRIIINGETKHTFASRNINPLQAISKIKDYDFSRINSSLVIKLEDNNGTVIDSVQVQLPIYNSYVNKKSQMRAFKNNRIIFQNHRNQSSKDTAYRENLSGFLMPNGILINEVLINPSSLDANEDGSRNSSEDSFVEIANYTSEIQDLVGWELYNGATLVHTFASPTNLDPGQLISVFGKASAKFPIAASSSISFDQSLFDATALTAIQTNIKEQVNCIMADIQFNIAGSTTEWIYDWNSYDRKRVQFQFPDENCPAPYNSSHNVPAHTTRFNRNYELRIVYYDAKGQIVDENIQTLSYDLLALPNPSITNAISGALIQAFPIIVTIANNNATGIAYELRISNPFIAYLASLNNPAIRTESFNFLRRKPLNDVKKKYAQIAKDRSGQISDYDKQQFQLQAKRDLKLYELSVHRNSDFNGWLMNWLWFNKGKLKVNPFNFSDLALALKPVEKEISEIEARISADIDYSLLNMLTEKDLFVFMDPVDLKKKRKEQASLKSKINAIKALQFNDQLLYKGRLFVSQDNSQINALMRHHDAKNKYVSWYEEDTKEVTEDQQLFVLVENEKPSTSIDIDVTVAAIEEEKTLIQEEAADQIRSVLGIGEIESKQAFYISDFSYSLPIDPIRDNTPEMLTGFVPYQIPVTAPANIEYTIKAGAAGKEKDQVKAKFRNNKLHSVRLKAGLLYSFLELQNVDTVANKIEKNDFGVDGTFGMQVYFSRTDIRKLGKQFRNSRPVAVFGYLGFSMKKLRENMYLGLGIEPYSGVSILGGLHIGERDKIGMPDGTTNTVIGREWKIGAFASIVIDVNVLTNLFGFSGIIPFE